MNSVLTNSLSLPSSDNVFLGTLTLEDVRQRAPAVFADAPHERTSAKYTFIPTDRVLGALMNAGFLPVQAEQVVTRRANPGHARHVLRLRRRYETVQLQDAIPEVVFLNSHDGTSAYQLRLGLFRAVCTNGLIVSRGAFQAVCVAHRGNIVDEVVEGAIRIAEQFEQLAVQVERMEARRLLKDDQLSFAQAALVTRYPNAAERGLSPDQLLRCRRVEDLPDTLWSTFNRVQENLLGGGLIGHSKSARITRTRRSSSIRENVRINSRLWDLATEVLAA